MSRSLAWLLVVRAYFVEIVRAKWLWALLVVCVLSSLATVLRSHHAYLDAADRYALELQERQRLRFAATVGPSGRDTDRVLRVLRPPNPVSVLIAGAERTMPSGWDFGPSGIETLPPYPSQISLVSLDVLADGESVIRLFGGLLGLALGFWLMTRDQQQGWLAAATSYPVHSWWPVGAMFLAGSLVLATISFLWMFVLRSVAAWLLGPAVEVGFAFFWAWFFVWAYLTTMFGIGSAVARMVPSPLAGTAVSVSIWTAAILIGPQLLSAGAYWTADLPPRARLEYDRRETYADRRRAAEDGLVNRLLGAIPDTPSRTALDAMAEEAFPQFEPQWREEMKDARVEANRTTDGWLRIQQLWLSRLETIARFTPATLLQSALATSNGQGWATKRWWEQAVHKHEAALNQALFDDRPLLNLRLYWNDAPFLWVYVRHPPLALSQLPAFDETGGSSAKHRGPHLADVAAALLQVVSVLLLAALYPAKLAQMNSV